ncbi:hypothetical protein ONZ45_g9073 [Pleurotus djamor]|nr:hypothetical protein ONZ45_g9073 [Pleurotus djamor]
MSPSQSPNPPVPPYIPPSPTKENLDFADLAIIDLSKAATPEGRAQLALQTREALASVGFFYVINHGYTPAQTKRMFDIANVAFSQVSAEEKQEYARKDMTTYRGYKLKKAWLIDGGVRDEIENYAIHHTVTAQTHPPALRPFLPEISEFAEHNHFDVLYPILKVLALTLELPEDTLIKLHGFDDPGESSVTFMKYYPRPEESEVASKGVWLKGHTDLGSITMLYSQPVGGLQILSRDGQWRYIKHIDNALVVNAGDTMEFLSGGHYRATIHRVIQPPVDQRPVGRLGLFYFSMPSDDITLNPLDESPVLKRIGITKYFEDGKVPTMADWRKNRTALYGNSELTPSQHEKGVEQEVIQGALVKHYN